MLQSVNAYLAAYLTVDESLTCVFPDVVLQFLKTQEHEAVKYHHIMQLQIV
jgi:hypothetical protein